MSQKRTRQNSTQQRAASHARRGESSRANAGRGSARHLRASRSGSKRAGQVTPRVADSPEYELNIPGLGEFTLTRRHFLYGAAGVAALLAIGGGSYAYTELVGSSNDFSTLKVPESSVFTTEECEQIENPETVVSLYSTQKLPYGTLVWANDDNVAAALLPTETAKPLTQIGLLSLGAGTCSTVVKNAIGQDDGFEIYDVRACSTGLVWTEANILAGTWRVYHAALSGEMSLGSPMLAEEGDSDWEMPTLAAVDGYAFWQVLPRLDGAAKKEDSKLKRAAFGSSQAEDVYISHGRMACAPYATHDCVVITPRADTSGTYYQLTLINAKSGAVLDALALPRSMKPLEAGYGDTGFSFAFEAIYNYGDGIANLGTYTSTSYEPSTAALNAAASSTSSSSSSASSDDEQPSALSIASTSAANYGSTEWFRFPRTPLTAPAWCGNWFMVKSTSSVCGVDFATKKYFALNVEDGTDDYGDFLASTGSGNRVVTYSNIDHTPLAGTRERHCLVRVWQAH